MTNNIKKIVFTGDIMRVAGNGTPSQWINIQWLEKSLAPALSLATGLPWSRLQWLINETDFNAHTVYSYLGLPATPEAWAALYYAEPTPLLAEHLASFVHDSLVVGFELSVFLKRCFSMMGISYIDIRMHPIRYMADLAFFFSTNNAGIRGRLLRFAMTEEQFQEEVSMAGGVARRAPFRPPRSNRRALICMQTRFDAVLIKDQQFVSWTDYLSDLKEIVRNYDDVLVKPHPLDRNGYELAIVMESAPGLIITEKNFYKLLAQSEVDTVYSLSSGTSIEAKYFGIDGLHLFRNYYEYEQSLLGANGEMVPVYQCFYFADFWRDILSDVVATTAQQNTRQHFLPNRSRQGIGGDRVYQEAFA